jgi:endo-1,4-beta-xylanase
MKKLVFLFLIAGLFACNKPAKESTATLKDALNGKFLIGAAINDAQVSGKDTLSIQIIKQQFNTITAENCMKSERIQPQEGVFDFSPADRFVEFGINNNMYIHGHTLIWHSQVPAWFFVADKGKDVSREVLIERMKNHIFTVVDRYKGKVKSWDVVNEAIMDDGSLRETKFYTIIGEDYIRLAFEFAREADPDAILIYNDYSMAHEGRRNRVVKMVQDLKEQGVKIDGIGMQGHIDMSYPPIEEFEKSLLAFADLGVEVSISELDLTILPPPRPGISSAEVSIDYEYQKQMNPYPNGLPDEVAIEWTNRYNEFFKLFLKHSDKISRVTLWGVTDNQTWRNNWPMRGRTDYPLLFDRNYQPKDIVSNIIQEAKNIN